MKLIRYNNVVITLEPSSIATSENVCRIVLDGLTVYKCIDGNQAKNIEATLMSAAKVRNITQSTIQTTEIADIDRVYPENPNTASLEYDKYLEKIAKESVIIMNDRKKETNEK